MKSTTGRTAVLYLSSAPSPAEFERIQSRLIPGTQHVSYGMPEASFRFHELLRAGLLADEQCSVTSLVGRPVSSRHHRGRWWPGLVEKKGRHTYVSPGFVSLPGIRQAMLASVLALRALQWRVRTRRAAHRAVIVDGAYVTALPLVLAAAGPRIPKIGIFADLYSYMLDVSDSMGGPRSVVSHALRRVTRAAMATMDGYVLLTEQMRALVNPDGKPSIVMEGVSDTAGDDDPVDHAPFPTLMYAGALRREYGLADLVAAVAASPRTDLVLEVFGQGDYVEELKQWEARDRRIRYRGSAPIAEIQRREREVSLLVNPRPEAREFTQFSFPSKVMEYLSSGTAVLSTRLSGIPEDYFRFVLPIEGTGAAGVAEALELAVAEGETALRERGRLGRAFVTGEKNYVVQGARLLELARQCET